jgi:hypothetical protein
VTDLEEKAELEARLVAARAKRDEIARGRAAREELATMRAQVEAEERAAKDDAAIAAAEAEHGPIGKKIAVVQTDIGAVIVKRPNHIHFRRFQDAGSTKSGELEKLVRPCLVYPPLSAFEALLEELPATLTRCADAVCGLAGVRAEEVSGKS